MLKLSARYEMKNRKSQVMDIMWGATTSTRTGFNILSGVGWSDLELKMLAGCGIEKANVVPSIYFLLSDNMKFLWTIIVWLCKY